MCAILAVVGIALLVIVVVIGGAVMLFWTRSTVEVGGDQVERAKKLVMQSEAEMRAAVEEESGTVMLSQDKLADLLGADFAAEPSREHFVAVLGDEHATELMRRQFTDQANGRQVSWLLRVEDVQAPEPGQPVVGMFSLPYTISIDRHSQTSSSILVRVEFPPSAVDDLIKIRRGQWVTVAGELVVNTQGRSAQIKAARVER